MKFVVAALCLLSFPVFAQVSGVRVSGTIKDQNGHAIAGAKVVLSNVRNHQPIDVTTEASGDFRFENVMSGAYSLRVDAAGFAVTERSIQVRGDSAVGLEIVLEVSEGKFAVSAEVGRREEIRNIPQAISIIDSDSLLNRATSVLAQAGEEEAGLNVQNTSPTIGAIVIRGMTGKNVVNYLDGVRYTNGAQRGGINTFFNLNEPTSVESIEVLRGPNGAQYGSDSLAGTVNLLTKVPEFGGPKSDLYGEINSMYATADRGLGSNLLIGYGTKRFGGYVNLAARRINDIRTADGIDSHSAITRFLGLPSNVMYDRNPATGFTQYGGSLRLNYAPRDDQQLSFYYQRSQQDGGKRFDQLIGGDGNLIADLRNLMLDFSYLRYVKQGFGPFDTASFTTSYNAQREERVNQGGQGNPFGDVTHQYERTHVFGFSTFFDKELPKRNSFLVGADAYFENINSPAFTTSPVTGNTTLSRPRIPDDARFDSAGIFVQDAWEAVPERLRITGALRYGGMRYRARASDSPVVDGQPLWNDDELSTADFSGRIGVVVRAAKGFRFAVNYGRGFRYPSMTDLGTLGLTGDGYEVDHITAGSLYGTIGTTAGSDAVSTGLAVEKQRSEISHNLDFSLRYENRRFDTEFTVFRLEIEDAITKQSLILPQGSVGLYLGDQQITGQLPNGVVFVAASTSPVLVRANFTAARLFGLEYEAEAKVTDSLKLRGNFTYIRSEDKDTGLPPNIEGGTPPPTGFVSARWLRSGYWIEIYSTMALKQDRLSTLDLSDRRTGASRSRTQIENFFRRGACVRGLTFNATGVCNGPVGTYTLRPTGENIIQVLNRVLGPGSPTLPLFTYLPAYATVNLRGGFSLTEKAKLNWAFENIFDQFYRNPSWGIDGTGRSITVQLRYKF